MGDLETAHGGIVGPESDDIPVTGTPYSRLFAFMPDGVQIMNLGLLGGGTPEDWVGRTGVAKMVHEGHDLVTSVEVLGGVLDDTCYAQIEDEAFEDSNVTYHPVETYRVEGDHGTIAYRKMQLSVSHARNVAGFGSSYQVYTCFEGTSTPGTDVRLGRTQGAFTFQPPNDTRRENVLIAAVYSEGVDQARIEDKISLQFGKVGEVGVSTTQAPGGRHSGVTQAKARYSTWSDRWPVNEVSAYWEHIHPKAGVPGTCRGVTESKGSHAISVHEFFPYYGGIHYGEFWVDHFEAVGGVYWAGAPWC